MKLALLITWLIGLAIAFPNGASPGGINSLSSLYLHTREGNGVTCDDCQAKYDTCVNIAGVRNVNGGGCEKICAKRACQFNEICIDCDDDFLNCTGLNLYPAPTIFVPESEEDKKKEEEEKKKKDEEDRKKKEEEEEEEQDEYEDDEPPVEDEEAAQHHGNAGRSANFLKYVYSGDGVLIPAS